MLAGVPVLAANEGGPLETVIEDRTGWLRDVRDTKQWTSIMAKVLDLSAGERGRGLLKSMGMNGRERVRGVFSKEGMAKRLEGSLDEVEGGRKKRNGGMPGWVWVVSGVVLLAVVVGWGCMEVLLWALHTGEGDAALPTSSVPAKVRGEL